MIIEYQLKDIEAVAKKIAKEILPGDVVGLVGELAAGKTTFTQALLKTWGYDGPVNSPTYVIEHHYPINSKDLDEVVHLDFYRLDAQSLAHFDWSEYTNQPKKIILIEWPGVAAPWLPERLKTIRLEQINEKTRRLTLSEHLSR